MTVCESPGVLLKNINYWAPPKPHESKSLGTGPVFVFLKSSPSNSVWELLLAPISKIKI